MELISGFIKWLIQTALFFAIFHLAVPTVVHAWTKNSWGKLPVMVLLGIASGSLMAYFEYVPFLLLVIWLTSVHSGLKVMSETEFEEEHMTNVGAPVALRVYRISMYSYVFVSCLVAVLLQTTVVGPDGELTLLRFIFS